MNNVWICVNNLWISESERDEQTGHIIYPKNKPSKNRIESLGTIKQTIKKKKSDEDTNLFIPHSSPINVFIYLVSIFYIYIIIFPYIFQSLTFFLVTKNL